MRAKVLALIVFCTSTEIKMSLKTVKLTSSPGWICPSFEGGSETGNVLKPPQPKKQREERKFSTKRKHSYYSEKKNVKLKDDDVPWTEKFSPETKDELAVHKKKVSEVEDWLRHSLKICKSGGSQGAPLLLLTGPAGAGKTATIKALCKDLHLELNEWSSAPHESTPYVPYREGVRYVKDDAMDILSQSQASIFSNFLLRANKYQSLFSSVLQKMVLVEEFPNVFLRDASTFHNILRRFYKTARSSAVFIVSDCTTGESAEQRLFPKDLQLELNIANISFNPVAPTMLLKVLNNIYSTTNVFHKGTQLSKTEFEEMSLDSGGDIRNAINALQFFCTPRNSRLQTKSAATSSKVKKTCSSQSSVENHSNRDSSLFLFHALGKILYCKRGDTKSTKDTLPLHLSHLERLPLKADPEEVFKKTSISAEGFTLFLQQNYLSFIEDIEVAADCSRWLSEADVISVEWSEREVLNDYTASLATRGLMFNLTPSSSSNRWKPLHKPQFYSNIKNSRSLSTSLRRTFKETRLSLRELQIEFVPYLSKMRISLQNSEQCKAVNQIGLMSVKKSSSRSQCESLSVKDLFDSEIKVNQDDYMNTRAVNVDHADSTVSSYNQEDLDEEIVIEECDF